MNLYRVGVEHDDRTVVAVVRALSPEAALERVCVELHIDSGLLKHEPVGGFRPRACWRWAPELGEFGTIVELVFTCSLLPILEEAPSDV